MTLRQQLLIAVSALFLVVFLGMQIITVFATKNYLQLQLASHAQDAAVALSHSIADPLAKKDTVNTTIQIQSVFDRGFYQKIIVFGTDGKLVISRELPLKIENVPAWFSSLVSIETSPGEEFISSGWRQLGKVVVVSQPTFAYEFLWRSFKDILCWMISIYLLVVVLTVFLLRLILKPLIQIEEVAEEIQNKRFRKIEVIPRARELKRVVMAMNAMSKKISDSLNAEIAKAEGYRKKAYSDLVTNLENRQGFDLQFNHLLSANDNFSSAALLVIEIDGLKDFNRDFGFLEGDAMLVAVAQIIQYGSEPNGRMVSRIGGAAFALVVVDMAVSLVELFADEIRHRLSKYFDTIDPGKILVFSIGCVEFTAQQNRGEIFAKVDFALETARTSGTRNTAFMKFGDPSIPMEGSISWRNVIQRALSEKRWALFAQPVLALGNGTLVQHEIFARLEDKSGNLVAASNFLPMALRHQLMPEIDKVVITLTIDMLAAPMDHFQDVSINISIQSITNQQFCTWLIEKLQASRQFCARLCVELSEFGCLTDLTATQNFIRMLKNLQVRFGIDHFGIDPRSMELLRQVPPDYIKLEGGLITALSDDEKNIDHLKSLVALAKSLDISVIAHNIESQKIRDLLIDNNVEFGQGFLLGAPVQVSSSYN